MLTCTSWCAMVLSTRKFKCLQSTKHISLARLTMTWLHPIGAAMWKTRITMVVTHPWIAPFTRRSLHEGLAIVCSRLPHVFTKSNQLIFTAEKIPWATRSSPPCIATAWISKFPPQNFSFPQTLAGKRKFTAVDVLKNLVNTVTPLLPTNRLQAEITHELLTVNKPPTSSVKNSTNSQDAYTEQSNWNFHTTLRLVRRSQAWRTNTWDTRNSVLLFYSGGSSIGISHCLQTSHHPLVQSEDCTLWQQQLQHLNF